MRRITFLILALLIGFAFAALLDLQNISIQK